MSKLTRVLALVIVILSVIGVVPSYADTVPTITTELALDGTMNIINVPKDYWYRHTGEEKRDYTPTLVKGQDGEYTLTMYEGTRVTLGGNYQKGVTVTDKFIEGDTNIDLYFGVISTRTEEKLTISTDYHSSGSAYSVEDGQGEVKETLKGRVQIGYSKYDFNKNEDVFLGKPITLNVVVKPGPDKKEELTKILKANGYEEGMTDIEKFWVIYSWITKNIDYDHSYNDTFEYRAPLRYGLTVCEGYSSLFDSMAKAVGLKSERVRGNIMLGPHAWNIVNIDGKWYEIDSTNDTGNGWGFHKALKGVNVIGWNVPYEELKQKGIEVSKEDYVWSKGTVERMYELTIGMLTREYEKEKEWTKLSRDEWAAKHYLYTQEEAGDTDKDWNELLDEDYYPRKELAALGLDAWMHGNGEIPQDGGSRYYGFAPLDFDHLSRVLNSK